jgi:hypothetical protein
MLLLSLRRRLVPDGPDIVVGALDVVARGPGIEAVPVLQEGGVRRRRALVAELHDVIGGQLDDLRIIHNWRLHFVIA